MAEAATPLHSLTAHELRDKLRNREVTATEIAESTFDRIRAVDDRVKAYLVVMEDSAMETARDVDSRIERGEPLPPLAGIPVGIKDLICTKGVATTCSSSLKSAHLLGHSLRAKPMRSRLAGGQSSRPSRMSTGAAMCSSATSPLSGWLM